MKKKSADVAGKLKKFENSPSRDKWTVYVCACSEKKGAIWKVEKNKGEGQEGVSLSLSDMSPVSRARKRDFADVALRRREAEGILADVERRETAGWGTRREERKKEGEREEDRARDARREGRWSGEG